MEIHYIEGSREFADWIKYIEKEFNTVANCLGYSSTLYYTIDYNAIINKRFTFNTIEFITPNTSIISLDEFIKFYGDFIISNLKDEQKETINNFYTII
jgi:hypothetical protein